MCKNTHRYFDGNFFKKTFKKETEGVIFRYISINF